MRRWFSRVAAFFILVVLACGAARAAESARKVALVIGNARYETLPLKTAVNDARQIAASLRELGFEVDLKENADWDTMLKALGAFTLNTEDNQVRLFYYAGHGMQVRSRNYLNPIGTALANERELRARSIDLDDFIERLGQASNGLSVVIVDACRNNPFAGMLRPSRGTSEGLAATGAPRGMLLAFSTGPNALAQDSIDGLHSPYTRRLLGELKIPGLPIEQVFKRVHAAVDRDTRRAQRPWLSTSLSGEFCFRTRADGACGEK